MTPVVVNELEVTEAAPAPPAAAAPAAPAPGRREVEDRAERHLRRVAELEERLRAD